MSSITYAICELQLAVFLHLLIFFFSSMSCSILFPLSIRSRPMDAIIYLLLLFHTLLFLLRSKIPLVPTLFKL